MKPQAKQWQAVADIFYKAVALPADERSAFVAKATEGDSQLLAEIQSLLAYATEEEGENEIVPISTESEAPATRRDNPVRSSMTFAPGAEIGDFFILRCIGMGGFATVYLARQNSLDRYVALKVSTLFNGEARTMAHLEHDHIVKVFSETADSERGIQLICMQFVPGTSLESMILELEKKDQAALCGSSLLEVVDALNRHQVTYNPSAWKYRELLAGMGYVEAVLWLGTRLADALAYAHGRGVLHLDVKPGNILFHPFGRPLLTDFNVSLDARLVGEGKVRSIGGTYRYMAPEQREIFDGSRSPDALSEVDHRADIFSLGLVLKELLDLVPSPGDFVDATLRRCLAPEPEKRFSDASALSKALEGCLELFRVRKALPQVSRFLDWAGGYPCVALTLMGLAPQVLGSFINITYNSYLIVGNLTEAQQSAFDDLLIYYNAGIYSLGALLWSMQILKLRKKLEGLTLGRNSEKGNTSVRAQVLAMPNWVVAITTLGWLPGALVFPMEIQRRAGALSPGVFTHFLLSFALSWIVAVAYSYLYTQLVCLRVLYPRCWVGHDRIRETAQRDLAPIARRVRLAHFLTGSIPLMGAVLLIFSGPDRFDPAYYQGFRILVILLIGLGMVGVILAYRAYGQIGRTMSSFLGRGLN